MAGHQRDGLGREVTDFLGATPRRLLGYGAATTLAGRGKVAKVGPPVVTEREAGVLGARLGPLPIEVPTLVSHGPGWLVMDEVPDHGGAWTEAGFAELLIDLARLHDTYQASPALECGWLRDPAGNDLRATLDEGGDWTGVELPEPLVQARSDPHAIAQIIATAQPLTLVHGDPTPHNVRRPERGRRVWIDWEWASAAPAAVDIACWLGEAPWQFGRTLDRDTHVTAYLNARSRPVDRAEFERTLDAALVLFLFANNLPSLARCSGARALQALLTERTDALARLHLI